MADDRPVEDPTEQLSRVTSDLADLRSTVLARLDVRPTGDIEPTIRTTPKASTLLLQGQAVNRLDQPVLWQWAQDQGLVIAGLFTNGNGSTTFGLPDFRGRVIVGAGGLAVGALVGADSITLSAAQMPAHDHGGANFAGVHAHDGWTTHDYGHSGHFPGNLVNVQSGASWGVAAWNSGGNYGPSHNHDIQTALDDGHSHTLDMAGSGAAFDNRQSSIALNWQIYC